MTATRGGTTAAWGFYGKNPFPLNIMLLFMPMDKMIGPDFERGLSSLKQVVEARASKMANLQIQDMTFKTTQYAAIREQITISDVKSFFESSFASINEAMQNAGATMTGAPAGIFYTWDEQNGTADLAAAIPIQGTLDTENMHMITVDGSHALYIDFYGNYDESELAHLALMKYMEENNIPVRGPVLEEYLTDPASVPDPNKWLTRVIYLTE